jgi:hypothetical protein
VRRIESLALLVILAGCAREGEAVPRSTAEAPPAATGRLETATFALG